MFGKPSFVERLRFEFSDRGTFASDAPGAHGCRARAANGPAVAARFGCLSASPRRARSAARVVDRWPSYPSPRHEASITTAAISTVDVIVCRVRRMTPLSDDQERDFLQFFEWGWGVRGAAYASGVPEHVAYAFLLELNGYAFDPADAEDVPCPRVIDAVYEHLRHGCGCSELQVADGLGICRPRFARWMAKSGPDGLPPCQALARALTRAYEEAFDAIEARKRDGTSGNRSTPERQAGAPKTRAEAN